MPFFGSLGILITRLLVVAAVVLNVVTTVLGNGLAGYADTELFSNPTGLSVDSLGNLYVADTLNRRIRKITPAGIVTTLAGQTTAGDGNGTGTSATFRSPVGTAVDSTGNVYVADIVNHRIRKITPEGVVTTFAGTTQGFLDGNNVNARFNLPQGVAVDSTGNVYVADQTNNRIRKITPAGVVTTLAGQATAGDGNGTGTSASFRGPNGIGLDSAGNVYVSELAGNRIRKITSLGVVTTLAGSGSAGYNNGTGTSATFRSPYGVTVDSTGNVYVADVANHSIRKITPLGLVTTFAGSGIVGSVNGTGTNALFDNPTGVTVNSAGVVYVADQNNQRIRRITPEGVVTTLVGSNVQGFMDSGQANFLFYGPSGIALDSTGNIYVTDNHSVRKITSAGVVSTLAGNGTSGFVDGTGVNARFNRPSGIAIDSAGILYVADEINHCIRKITPVGVVTTLAGNGTLSFSPVDGTGTNARFGYPQGVAVDPAGTVYVTEYINHCIRKITPLGVVTTFAGSTDGSASFVNGTGTTARFLYPQGITLDSAGNAYVMDSGNQRIRKITPEGVVSTFVGSGTGQFADGTGTNASFWNPNGGAFDSAGDLYVADNVNNRIRKITPAGVVSTLAGNAAGGTSGAFADGTGAGASFGNPNGVAVDSAGTVYVTDSRNHRIRKITPAAVVTTLVGSEVGYSDGGFFVSPNGLATDWNGTIYVTDTGNNRIRKITPLGVVTTLAGQLNTGTTNGTGTNARFYYPQGITVNSTGVIYVADTLNRLIRSITSTGVVSTHINTSTTNVGITVDREGIIYVSDTIVHSIHRIQGSITQIVGSGIGALDGIGLSASFNTPSGIVADIYGNLYVADRNNHRIRRITSDRTVTTLAGSTAGFADGTGTNAQFNFPYHLSIDVLGTLYVADQMNHRIRTVQTSTGVVSTLAGDGTAGFTPSRFNSPQGITVDRFRNAYVADTGNHSIRKIPNVYTLPENNGVVTTVAGSSAGFLDGTGIAARFNGPLHITVDLNGNLYVADYNNNRIRKITPGGVVTTFAGNGTAASGNGTGTNATFNNPHGITIDSDGNLYVTENTGNRIRKITPARVVTTLAGSTAGSTNATGTSATFRNPRGIAIDSTGNLYVADGGNNLVRKITPSAVVTTLAGSGSANSIDGTGTNAQFYTPTGITVDSESNVYVTEITHNVRKITPAGVVTRLAGFSNGFSMDGTGTSAGFLVPAGITFDSNGNLFVAEGAGRIRRIRLSDLVVTTLAGNGTSTSIDGTGTNATFNSPNGITVDSSGTIYATETNGCRIRKIGTGAVQVPLNRGVVTTFAGSGTAGATNATGTSATFNGPNGVAVDSAGTVYVADSSNHRIRRITPAGVVTTFAGSGSIGATDSSGTSASFNFPYGVAVDSAGVVYVGDTRNHRIRRITSAGVVTTLAGSLSNTSGFADGTGTSARFFEPQAVAVDSSGTVYVADTYNHRIRRITPAGVVTTLAGSGIGAGGPGTFSDGSGTSAGFNFPNGVAVDSAGTVYVADSSNHRIRRITPAGVVTTLAGSTVGSSDGTGTNASFSGPVVLAVDSSGSVYVCEVNNNRIRKITPAGVVTTLAGSTSGFLDGTGTNALFNEPRGIAVDSGGILYVADYLNHRIRKVQ